MNRIHLHLRREPFRARSLKGTMKPAVLVIRSRGLYQVKNHGSECTKIAPQPYDNILSRQNNI